MSGSILELAREFERLCPDNSLCLVGGAVRDLLIAEKTFDYDLVSDCSAIDFALNLQSQNKATVKSVHEPFGTAKIIFHDSHNKNLEFDLATARSEIYEFPGALPKAKFPVSIKKDLYRRDFTINSIAFQITHERQIIDPFNGVSDIKNKIIKVLHSESYYEDPTRIIRAARFASRFGYEIASSDILQIKNALLKPEVIGLMNRIRGKRIGIELKRLLELNTWIDGVEILRELDAWKLCCENLFIKSLKNSKENTRDINSWEARLLYLLLDNSSEKITSICEGLELTKVQKKQILNFLELTQTLDSYKVSEFNLKLLEKLKSLDENFLEILFKEKKLKRETYMFMLGALPTEAERKDIYERFKGKQVTDELEKLFKSRMTTLK